MILKYKGTNYECKAAIKEKNHIAIHTGIVEDNEEIIYHIYGDIDFDAVTLEGGTWTETADTTDAVLNALLGVGA